MRKELKEIKENFYCNVKGLFCGILKCHKKNKSSMTERVMEKKMIELGELAEYI